MRWFVVVAFISLVLAAFAPRTSNSAYNLNEQTAMVVSKDHIPAQVTFVPCVLDCVLPGQLAAVGQPDRWLVVLRVGGEQRTYEYGAQAWDALAVGDTVSI